MLICFQLCYILAARLWDTIMNTIKTAFVLTHPSLCTTLIILFVIALFQEADDDTSIKLADFGFAKRVNGDLSLSTLCGTAQYVAPEILDFQVDGYDERCDMWSVGVVTYILLGGYAPFEGEPDELAQLSFEVITNSTTNIGRIYPNRPRT